MTLPTSGPDLIFHYFPELLPEQKDRINALLPLYQEWNEKINVISRKDMDNLYLHHVLHSLAIAKYISFLPESSVLDIGTGGGLPGIPLAILFPETNFTLIDGTGKKIRVVQEISTQLGLENVTAQHIRVEEWKGSVDFVVSRAVAPLDQLMTWANPLISPVQKHVFPNGLICLKGGNLAEEITVVKRRTYVEVNPLSQWFSEDFFSEKYLVYSQAF